MELAIVFAAGQIAAGLALLNGMFTANGQGQIGAATIEAIARQPESAGAVRSTMFLTLGIAETSAIYGVVFAILLLWANPLLDRFVELVSYLPV